MSESNSHVHSRHRIHGKSKHRSRHGHSNHAAHPVFHHVRKQAAVAVQSQTRTVAKSVASKQTAHAPKNYEIARGINRFSRSQMSRRTRKYAFAKKGGIKKVRAEATAPTKQAKYYPADDVKKPRNRRFKPTTAKLRHSITPGTVLIVLSGRFRGKRVVFLKQLPSGLLLVTGPYKINGVPLRRVNQTYCIATSTKVDVSSVEVPDHINDSYFKRPKATKSSSESAFMADEATSGGVTAERKADQKQVDAAVLAAVKQTPLLKQYLNAKFSLKQGQFPHNMKF